MLLCWRPSQKSTIVCAVHCQPLQAGSDIFSVNFYAYGKGGTSYWGQESWRDTVKLESDQAAGFGNWNTTGWENISVPYKEIIPGDNDQFWDHYTTIYPSQPEGGNPDYQYGWYNVWKHIYDETHGTAARNAMQDIIDLYFPDGRPSGPSSSHAGETRR